MPALPDVPGVSRLILNGLMNGQPWAAVQYAQTPGAALTQAQVDALATGVSTAWNNAMAQGHSTAVTLTQVTAQDLTSKTGAIGVSTVTHPGTRAGTPGANNIAAVASWKIAVRYRGGHPRTYWPAGVQGDVTAGRLWSGTFKTLMESAIAGYVTNINAISLSGSSVTFCAVSFYHGKDATTGKPIVRDVPLVYPVISSVFHTRVDTMRRRLGKETG